MAAKKTKEAAVGAETVIRIPAANIQVINLTLVGVGEGLLVHRFGESAMREMEAKTLGEAQAVKPPRNYEQEFEEARYIHDGKDVYPTAGIKKTMVEACGFVDGVFKTTARGAFFILGEWSEIKSDPPELHKVIAWINGGRIPVVRIRPLYRNWTIDVSVRYDANIISAEQLVYLFVKGGFSVGLGDWRPQCSGSFGMFEVRANNNGATHGKN